MYGSMNFVKRPMLLVKRVRFYFRKELNPDEEKFQPRLIMWGISIFKRFGIMTETVVFWFYKCLKLEDKHDEVVDHSSVTTKFVVRKCHYLSEDEMFILITLAVNLVLSIFNVYKGN
ncbi:hypothetical protein CHUAL_009009 [Chamberlinius hualienensis]